MSGFHSSQCSPAQFPSTSIGWRLQRQLKKKKAEREGQEPQDRVHSPRLSFLSCKIGTAVFTLQGSQEN